jgi:hypothetical protein
MTEHRRKDMRCILISLFAALHTAAFAQDEVKLAAAGKALLPVVAADESLHSAAMDLATMLSRMSGAEFEVIKEKSECGILLALHSEPPLLTQREDYTIRTNKDQLLITGRTPLAVGHAVWDVCYRLGFRQYLPGKKWEIVPRHPELNLKCDVSESPDYHTRSIWAGFGYTEERKEVCGEWNRRNRATQGIELKTGHAYDGVMERHQGEFAAHPEYLALVNGKRQKPKFCTANEGLRKLVVSDALEQFRKHPELDSISCDPSDGGGWCECAECAKLGSVSDRALILANAVAAAVQDKHPGRFIGMYAYNEHSPPPSVEAHPQVVISVATSFIRGGFTVDQLINGWSGKARTLGIREYYSVNTWDRDMPGAARGGDIGYLRETIPHFHSKGARFMSAEASDNAGPNGLGCYLASRMLWDVKEAEKVEAHVADFLERCFGSAREPMAAFYKILDGTNRQPVSDDLVGRMFRHLDAAWKATSDVAVHERLSDLVLYTQYVGMYLDYSSAAGAERQAAFEQLFRHVWRIRETGMVHTKALWRDLPNRDRAIKLPAGATYKDADQTNPWKTDPAYTAEQVAELLSKGIETRKLLDFEPVAFSMKLVPASPLKLKAYSKGKTGPYQRGVRDYWTYLSEESGKVRLSAKAGLVYTNRGVAKVELYPLAEAESKSVAHAEVPPDKTVHELTLDTRFPGLHRIEIDDSNQGTLVEWPEGTPMTLISSREQPARMFSRWYLHFYVPKGTRVIGGFSDGDGWLCDPHGKTVHEFTERPGFFSIPVPPGEDGKLWSFKNSAGNRHLMTVPPCLARDASELLLPEEVVKRDSK